MKKIAALVLLTSFLVPFSGCAGNFEIDRELIVEAVGVDLKDGRVLLTLQTLDAEPHPAGEMGSSDGNITAVRSAEGATVTEAAEKIAADAGREPVFSQTRIAVLGKSVLAGGNVRRYLDMFARSYQLRNDCYLAAADRAGEIVGAEIGSGKIAAVRLQRIMENGGESAFCVPVPLYGFLDRLNDPAPGEFLPILTLNGKKEPSLAGTAVLTDGIPATELDGRETQILALLTLRVKNGSFTAGKEETRGSFTVLRSVPKRKRDAPGGQIEVRCLCDTAELFREDGAAADALKETERTLTAQANALLRKLELAGAVLPDGSPAPSRASFRIRLRR